MPFYDPYSGQEVETEEERRQREQQELADTAVHTQETKTYGDGTQEVITKQEIPPAMQATAAPVRPVAPQAVNQAAYTAQQESGGKTNIGYHFPANEQGQRTSTAYGMYGLTAPAYKDIQQANPAFAGRDITTLTPEEQTAAYQTFTGLNAQRLQRLGVEPTEANQRLAHLLGAGGAAKFIQTGEVNPAAAAANGGIDNLKRIAGQRLAGQAAPASGAAQTVAPVAPAMEQPGFQEANAGIQTEPVSPYSLATGAGTPGLKVPGMTTTPTMPTTSAAPIDLYQNNQDNPMELMKLHQDTTQPEWIRSRAGERVADLITQQRNQKTAEDTLPTLSQTDLAKIATKKSDGNSVGDWMQYLLFKHVGLSDLANAKAEQLGIGHKWQGAMDAEGNTGLIKYSASGLPLEGTKANGQPMSNEELTAYAAQGIGKSSDVSLTMHQALVDGKLHTFESKRTPNGLMYRDATANGSWTRNAPEGMANIGQQDPAHVKGLTAANSVVTRMSKANADAIAATGRPQFSQEQIQQARDSAYSNVTGKPMAAGAAMAGAVPASVATTGTAPAPAGAVTQATATKAPKSLAQQILDYEAPPPVGPSTGTKIAIQNEVNRLAAEQGKTFNAGNYNIASKFNNSQSGKALKSINVAVDHLDTLQEAANELKNGQTPAFNKIAQLYASNTGSTAPGNFDALKSIVGSEVAKAVVGGASALGDREEIRKEINNSKTPEQLAGVIGRFQALMAGQAKGIRQEWVSSGLDENRFDDKLMPRTKVVLNKQKEPTRSNY